MRAVIAFVLALTALPQVASAQTKPNNVKSVGPWEIVQWVRGATVSRCTVIRDKRPAGAPSYGFLIDGEGLLLSVESNAWTLTPERKVRAIATASGGAARTLDAVPVSAARANIELGKDRALLGELQTADKLEVQIGGTKVSMPFDDFNAARVVFESCVMTLGKSVSAAH